MARRVNVHDYDVGLPLEDTLTSKNLDGRIYVTQHWPGLSVNEGEHKVITNMKLVILRVVLLIDFDPR